MKKVCLSGNIFHDTICLVDNFPQQNESNIINKSYSSIGGIANLKRIFDIYPDIKSYCSTLVGTDEIGKRIKDIYYQHDIQEGSGQTSHSVIIADTSSNLRTSLVHWGIGTTHVNDNPFICDWHHISYLDTLINWSPEIMKTVKDKSKIVTVDFCQSNHDATKNRIFDCLQYVNGIIASDVELYSLFNSTKDEVCLYKAIHYVDFCILHTPRYVSYRNRKGLAFTIPIIPIPKKINALGAGDTFCSYVIINQLSGLDEFNSINDAIVSTKQFLEASI